MAAILKRTTKAGARYDVRVRIGGRQVSQTFTRLREADAYAKEIEASRLRGTAVDPAGGRIDRSGARRALADVEHGEARQHYRPRSFSTRSTHRPRHRRPPPELRPPTGSAEPGQQMGRPVGTPNGKPNVWNPARRLCFRGSRSDLISRSPCRNIKLPKHEARSRPVVSPELVGRIVDAIDERYRPMVWVAGMLGLRWGKRSV